ncbi:hypothetical protein ACOMHN_046214 [Nucella lapillus]
MNMFRIIPTTGPACHDSTNTQGMANLTDQWKQETTAAGRKVGQVPQPMLVSRTVREERLYLLFLEHVPAVTWAENLDHLSSMVQSTDEL